MTKRTRNIILHNAKNMYVSWKYDGVEFVTKFRDIPEILKAFKGDMKTFRACNK